MPSQASTQPPVAVSLTLCGAVTEVTTPIATVMGDNAIEEHNGFTVDLLPPSVHQEAL